VPDDLAGRAYARVYRVQGKRDLHDFLLESVEASRGRVLYASEETRAPLFLGVQAPMDERVGILCYPFRCSTDPIKGRDLTERRIQVRYGGETSWEEDHPLGIDVAGVDVTIAVGIDLDARVFVGLDPVLYDPLPMGISVEYKIENIEAAVDEGWTVWERESRPGRRRGAARSEQGVETLLAFRPERLLDYARFERYATSLGLDPPLRFRAAQRFTEGAPAGEALHQLEAQFDLTSRQLLDIISRRYRLEIALRGGVAEHHLEMNLAMSSGVQAVEQIDQDGQPDFLVTLDGGHEVTIECKNVSPVRRANGDIKVEVQKTRSSRDDPAGRFYRRDQFDLVAASLWPVTGRWEFCFKATEALDPHPKFPDRVAPIQVVDHDTWSDTVTKALQ
jgi:hypothetical protein